MTAQISLRDLAKCIAATIDPLEQDRHESGDELRTLACLDDSNVWSGADFATGVLYLANRTCTRKRHEERRAVHFGWLDAMPEGLLIRYTVTPEIVRLWMEIATSLRSVDAILSALYFFEAESLQGWASYRDVYRTSRR